MQVHAEPRPLDGPLPGGGGGSVTVEPILAGEMQLPPGYLAATGGRLERAAAYGLTTRRSGWVNVPVPVFLIRHPTAGPILVDTGFHPSVAAKPAANLGRGPARLLRPRVTTGEDLPGQLRKRDVDPRSVKTVILTHLHLDHASGIAEFPHATFVITDEEWAAAVAHHRTPLPRPYRPAHLNYLFDYRTLDYQGDAIASYGNFGRTFDLFGDGTIHLAHTPGHSAGHQSVICRLADRDFVIAGDAVLTRDNLDGKTTPAEQYDAHNWRRSQRELQRFAERYPDAVIVPGHDPQYWATLAQRYE